MERKTSKAGGVGGIVLLFLVGFVGALVVGWVVFPSLLYCKSTQPIRFSHTVHAEQGVECEQCHYLNDAGQFIGLPSTESCAECHDEETGGDSPDEKEIDKFVKEYASTGAEVPWLVYQHQPDNVFFSHSAHQGLDCAEAGCHPNVAEMENPPVLERNLITGYTKTTMKMWRCERCHAEMGASNACYVCHK